VCFVWIASSFALSESGSDRVNAWSGPFKQNVVPHVHTGATLPGTTRLGLSLVLRGI